MMNCDIFPIIISYLVGGIVGFFIGRRFPSKEKNKSIRVFLDEINKNSDINDNFKIELAKLLNKYSYYTNERR